MLRSGTAEWRLDSVLSAAKIFTRRTAFRTACFPGKVRIEAELQSAEAVGDAHMESFQHFGVSRVDEGVFRGGLHLHAAEGLVNLDADSGKLSAGDGPRQISDVQVGGESLSDDLTASLKSTFIRALLLILISYWDKFPL